MDNISKPKIIRVKRKRTDEPSLDHTNYKRSRLIGTLESLEVDNFQSLIQNNMLENFDFDIVDIDQKEEKLLNTDSDVITCNGIPMNSSHQNFDYLYDIYYIDGIDDDANDYFEDKGDEEVSSNDENYEYNDYPDEDSVLNDDADFYDNWRYDEEYEDEEILRKLEEIDVSEESSED